MAKRRDPRAAYLDLDHSTDYLQSYLVPDLPQLFFSLTFTIFLPR